MRLWSEEDEAYLVEYYGKMDMDTLCSMLDRSRIEVNQKAYRMGLGISRRRWENWEIEHLKSVIDTHSRKEIALELNRTENSINSKVKALGMVGNKTWNEELDKCIMQEYKNNNIMEVSNRINKSRGEIMRRLGVLGIHSSREWCTDEDNIVASNNLRDCMLYLYRSKCDIEKRKAELGLTKKTGKTKFTREMDEYILENTGKKSYTEIGRKFNVDSRAIKNRIYYLEKKNGIDMTKLNKEDTNFIVKNCIEYTVDELAIVIKKSKNIVKDTIKKFGLEEHIKQITWTSDMDNIIIEESKHEQDILKLKKRLGISELVIKERIKHLGIDSIKNSVWTKREEIYLFKNYYSLPVKELALILQKSVTTIRNKAHVLGIIKNERWTEEEIEFLLANRGKLTLEELCVKLNRSESAVRTKMYSV